MRVFKVYGAKREILQIRVPFKVLSKRVPYYFGDLARDPNLENYPCGCKVWRSEASLASLFEALPGSP